MSTTEEGLSVMQQVLSGAGTGASAAGAGQGTASDQGEGGQADGAPAQGAGNQQADQAAQTGAAGTGKVFTQEQVDALIREASQRAADSVVARERGRQGVHQEALNLWKYLEENPDLAQKVQEIIDSHTPAGQDPVNLIRQLREQFQNEISLTRAELDLAKRDPVFAEHQEQIKQWAEARGLPIRTAKDLQIAVMAFKGSAEYQQVLAKQAQGRKAQEAAAARGAQRVMGPAGARPAAPDYRKMTPQEVLRAEGLSLYTKE